MIFDEKCESWSSSLCICLRPPVTSSSLGPNIPLRADKIFTFIKRYASCLYVVTLHCVMLTRHGSVGCLILAAFTSRSTLLSAFLMKSSRCVLILIYLINHIVSVNTTNKFKFYCDMFRPHSELCETARPSRKWKLHRDRSPPTTAEASNHPTEEYQLVTRLSKTQSSNKETTAPPTRL